MTARHRQVRPDFKDRKISTNSSFSNDYDEFININVHHKIYSEFRPQDPTTMAGSRTAAAAAAGKKRKNNSTNSDFKRIKARVGKKAIKINETDVSFKSASLRVNTEGQQSSLATPSSSTAAENDGDSSVGTILISSRGKTVDELIIQLGHPAAAVRRGALKGIQDIVKKNTTNTKTTNSSSVLLPYLSVLIPSCIHTCVDEDADVRCVGIDVVVALLQPHTTKQIRPFGPLIMARISSALHSLDPPTRQDGVRFCHQITSKFPSLLHSGGGGGSTTSTSLSYRRLLPSFTHLLSDPQTKKTLDETLLALVSILRAASSSTNSESSLSLSSQFDLDTPDLIYKSGDRSKNSVIVLGKRPFVAHQRGDEPAAVRCYESLSHLPVIEDEEQNSEPVENEGLQSKSQNVTETKTKNGQQYILSNLLEKLRDVLLESMNTDNVTDALDTQHQQNISLNKKKSNPLGSSDSRRIHLERSVVVLRAVRLLYRLNLLDIKSNAMGSKPNNATGYVGPASTFEAHAKHILSLSMDAFPVSDHGVDAHDDGEEAKTTEEGTSTTMCIRNRLEDEVNAAIVATLLDVSFTGSNAYATLPRHKTNPQDRKRNEGWLKMALMYILPRIPSSLAADLHSSSIDLETTCRLARHLSHHNIFPSALLKLLQSIQESVFSSEEDIDVARSVVGRKLYLLMMEFAEDDPNLPLSATGSSKSEILAKIVLMAPFYLGVWKNHFLYETHSVLCRLKPIIQRIYESDDCPIIDELRKRFFWLVKQKKTDDEPKRVERLSVLETYPLQLQKRTLGLIVLLQSPQEDCLEGLSAICSRSWKSSLVLSGGILDAVHSIRTTVPMKSYLTFLIGSIGLSNQVKDLKRKISKSGMSPANFDELLGPIDSSLKSISAILVQCGTSRILPVLLPQLMAWFNSSQSENLESDIQSLSALIKKRAAIVILAYLSLATHTVDPAVSLPLDLSKLTESLCSFVDGVVSNQILSSVQYKMVLPLVGLMSSDDSLLAAFLEKICCDWFRNNGIHRNRLMDSLTLLQNWVSDQRLYESITRNSSNSQILLKSFHGLLKTPAVSKDNDISSKTKHLIAAIELC